MATAKTETTVETKASKKSESRVECRECGFKDHILIPHIVKKHEMTPEAYLDKHGGVDMAPLWSSFGAEKIRETQPGSKAALLPRPKKAVPIKELLPDIALKGYEIEGDYKIFATPGPRTPTLDPTYVFPVEQTLDFLTIIEKKMRNRIFIKGWSGTGKTTLVFNIAALLNINVREVNFDAFMTYRTLIGGWVVKDGATVWQYGVIPLAMMHGDLLLINEIDAANPIAVNVLKTMLEDPPRLTIPENGGEIIAVHPDFRVVATANTWGRGDTSGLFVNTHTQSDADTRRWSARILIDYMDPETELALLKGYFPDLDDDDGNKFIMVANRCRDAFKASTIDKTFSPAELVNWVENYQVCGKGVHHAARLSFLNALEPDVATAISEMLNAVFGPEEK